MHLWILTSVTDLDQYTQETRPLNIPWASDSKRTTAQVDGVLAVDEGIIQGLVVGHTVHDLSFRCSAGFRPPVPPTNMEKGAPFVLFSHALNTRRAVGQCIPFLQE